MSALHALVDEMAEECLDDLSWMKLKALYELRQSIKFANRSIGQKRRQRMARIVARDWQVNRGVRT
jgi:hypothetical protein